MSAGNVQLLAQRVLEELPTTGTAILCSSSAKFVSRALADEPYTMFSGALLQCLRSGVEDKSTGLSLSEVGEEVRRRIMSTYDEDAVRPELHVPDQTLGNISEISLFPNPAAITKQLLPPPGERPICTVSDWLRLQPELKEPLRSFKYDKMRQSFWYFYRAVPELVFGLWRDPLRDTPVCWLSGSIHHESFGTYISRSGTRAFDVIDYDDSILGPCAFDLFHFLVGTFVTAKEHKLLADVAEGAAIAFLRSYAAEVRQGEPKRITLYDNDKSALSNVLRGVRRKSLKRYFAERMTEGKDGRPLIRVDNDRATEMPLADSRVVMNWFNSFVRDTPALRAYQAADAARRMIGVQHVELTRYLILAINEEAKNEDEWKDKCAFFELSQVAPSALGRYVGIKQPRWQNEVVRVSSVQERMEPLPHELSCAVEFCGEPHLFSRLRADTDRVGIRRCRNGAQFVELCETMGKVTAWGHLRGAGWKGAVNKKQLASLRRSAVEPLVDSGHEVAHLLWAEWADFRRRPHDC